MIRFLVKVEGEIKLPSMKQVKKCLKWLPWILIPVATLGGGYAVIMIVR
ncbi:MAG TPA: hypothetical protein VHP11_07500 [Tepidisphaeraceae bacterium]|nr:hypothetical protein [Tepidisphaeraceae bacterium]